MSQGAPTADQQAQMLKMMQDMMGQQNMSPEAMMSMMQDNMAKAQDNIQQGEDNVYSNDVKYDARVIWLRRRIIYSRVRIMYTVLMSSMLQG
jgi:hypothetical protein